jgi:hypothetical protein
VAEWECAWDRTKITEQKTRTAHTSHCVAESSADAHRTVRRSHRGHDRVRCLYYSFESGHCSLVAFVQSLAAQQLYVPEVLTDTAMIKTSVKLEYIARLWTITVHSVPWEFRNSHLATVPGMHYAASVGLLHVY